MSADASARKVGVAAAPEVGPAKTWFAVCVASENARVPLEVIGEPVTARIDGTVAATLVTVPEPPPEAQAAGSHTVPSKTRQLPLDAPPAVNCDGWNITVGDGTVVERTW
jgi:hypothetical protein